MSFPTPPIGFPSAFVPASDTRIEEIQKKVDRTYDVLTKKIAKRDALMEGKVTERERAEVELGQAYQALSKSISKLEGEIVTHYTENTQWSWCKQWADGLSAYYYATLNQKDRRLYALMEAEVDESRFAHFTSLYVNDEQASAPAYLRRVGIAPAIRNRIVGEVNAAGLRYGVSVINSEAINAKIDEHAKEVADKVTKQYRQRAQMQQALGVPLVEGDEWQTEAEDFEDMDFKHYKTDKEVMIKDGLDYLTRNVDLAYKYKLGNQGMANYLATNKLCNRVIVGDNPDIKSIDSRNLIAVLSGNSPFIQHGMAAGEWFEATPQELMDMYPNMSERDREKLNSWIGIFMERVEGYESVLESCGCFVKRDNEGREANVYVNCFHFNVRASKRLRVQIIENKFDVENPHIKYVDDKANAEGAKYRYKYLDEIWEMTKIGLDIYVNMRPLPNQHTAGGYASRKTLDYVGIIDPNPSIMQLIEPFEELRTAVFYTLEKLTAQAKGKILLVDEANESMDAANSYNMNVHSIYKYNSAKEGDQQLLNPNGAKNLNKPDVVDFGIASSTTALYSFLNYIDINVDRITGINGARRGELKSDTGLGQMEQSNAASAMATQPYFTVYYTVVSMTLQKVCEAMQRSWGGKDIVKYFLGEDGMKLLNLMKETEWWLDQYGVFVDGGVNDAQMKANIQQIANAMLPIQTDPNIALALIKMYDASSAKEAQNIFEEALKVVNKYRDEQAAAQQQASQVPVQIKQAEEEAETMRVKMKIDGDIAVKQLEVQGELQKESMKQDFKMGEQTVKKQNAIDETLVEAETQAALDTNRKVLDTVTQPVTQ